MQDIQFFVHSIKNFIFSEYLQNGLAIEAKKQYLKEKIYPGNVGQNHLMVVFQIVECDWEDNSLDECL